MKVKLIMNANDVQAITDYSIGHCRRILREIRKSKRKLKHQKVTVKYTLFSGANVIFTKIYHVPSHRRRPDMLETFEIL